MKKFFLALTIAFLSLSAQSRSQEISYLIPDIGTPDFYTYVEIIAPHDGTGNFGSDGLYLNNPGDNMRLEVVNSADTNKLTIGPFVVSWNGRMIAAHFFVHPDVEPNSDYWDDLRNEFRIPIRAVISGSNSTVDTFYIVQPTELGTLSVGDGAVVGQGSLGKRSRRGAMIVGDVTFANQVYRVSTQDCDPYTNGNQSYLPFTMLSTGKIIGSGATLNLDGGYTVIRDAAPGGGGGGGNFCDAWFLNQGIIGSEGGDGYTAGGAGGRNNSGGGNADTWLTDGAGSGLDGNSLNGVPVSTPVAYESAGGGTGHPFGLSGFSCNDGGSCNHEGGYGGGSGHQQTDRGGSGGFATEGTNSGGASPTAGNVHGNEYLIPLAGGSGGASGNPQGGGDCSGSGGAGGGAIRLYADLEVAGLTISAKGADGQTGEPAGGSGSGGGVDIISKKTLNINANTSGGAFSGTNFGGNGRVSWAAQTMMISPNTAFQPASSSVFQSMSTDTNKLVSRSFNLEGTRNQNKNIRIFLKPENGNWMEVSGINYLNQIWDIDLSLAGPDSLYFLSAILVTDDGDNTNQYLSKPDFIHSQASANILKIDKLPICEGDSIMNFYPMQCDGSEDLDTAYVKNTGEGNLILEMQNHTFAFNTPGFELVQPIDETVVLPEDSVAVIVRYTYQDGQPSSLIDSLLIPHNDFQYGSNPWSIALNVESDTIHIEYWDVITLNEFERVVFGDNCINSGDTLSFYVVNFSDFPVTINHAFEHITGNAFSLQYPEGNTLEADSSLRVLATFNPDLVGLNESMLIFGIDECDTYSDTLYLEGNGVTGEFEFFNTQDTLDLGEICIGAETTELFWAKNLSLVDVVFENPGSSNDDFKPELIGRRSVPPNDTTTFLVRFTPTIAGEQVARVLVFFNECGGDFDTLYVKGTGTTAIIDYEANQPNPIDFGIVCVGEEKTIDVVFRNGSLSPINIKQPTFSDPDNYYGKLLGSAYTVGNDTILVSATFAPKAQGVFNGFIQLSTDDCGGGMIEIPVTGEGVTTRLEFVGTGDFDDTNVGERQTKEIILRNNGDGDAYIQSLPNIGPAFRVLNTNPALPVLLKENETIRIEIEFAPNVDGEITKVMIVESIASDGACPTSTSVLLKGVGVRTEIRVSTFILDYGLLTWCETKQDSVIIGNDGTVPFSITELATITGNDPNSFSIAQHPQPNPTPTIQPGDSVVYYIRFLPEKGNEGIKNAQLVIKTDASNMPEIQIDLIGESEDLHLDYNLSDIEFGDVPIGESSSINITISNNGRKDWRIELKCREPQVTVVPAGLTIFGNTDEVFIATFRPTQEGPFTAHFDLILFTPCKDTLFEYINLPGRGIGGDIILPDTLDLGEIYNCGILNQTLEMRNTGEAAIEIVDMTIEDDPDSHFDYPDDQIFPVTVEAGSDFSRDVVFYGNESPDGFYYAKAIIKVIVNKDTSEKTVILKAEINDGMNIDPTTLDFGELIFGLSRSMTFTIENDGLHNITITSLSGFPTEYTIIPDWTTVLPTTLTPGDQIMFEVMLTPTAVNENYDGRIDILYNAEDCPEETAFVTLIGNSVAGKGVILRLPLLNNISPDIDNYSIPIFASADEDLRDTLTLTAEVAFDGTMFMPTSITNGSIISQTWDNYNKTLRFEINVNQISTQETVIAQINGSTLLGRTDNTILSWNETDYSWIPLNTVTETTFQNGTLQTEICDKGGERLLDYSNLLALKIQPNPADDNLQIEIAALEIGHHSLELVNIHGSRTRIADWTVTLDGDKEFTFNSDIRKFSSGSYYVVLKSPTDRIVEPVFIIK